MRWTISSACSSLASWWLPCSCPLSGGSGPALIGRLRRRSSTRRPSGKSAKKSACGVRLRPRCAQRKPRPRRPLPSPASGLNSPPRPHRVRLMWVRPSGRWALNRWRSRPPRPAPRARSRPPKAPKPRWSTTRCSTMSATTATSRSRARRRSASSKTEQALQHRTGRSSSACAK